jgi:phosphohistidine phosphatase
MNLIVWRHAEAEDSEPEIERKLTARGHKQAEKMATWLRSRLPEAHQVSVSPARRTIQTADALTHDYRIDPRLAPGADPALYLAALDWPVGPPDSGGTMVLVGHQPFVGQLVSLVLTGSELDWSVKKGALWWLATREREGGDVIVRAVVSADML